MTNALNQIVYGRPIVSDEAAEAYDTLAESGGLSAEDVRIFQQNIPLGPVPVPDATQSQAVAIFNRQNNAYILARAHNQLEDVTLPVYQYISLPGEILSDLAGFLQPLVELIVKPIMPYTTTHVEVQPLELPAPITWSMDRRLAILRRLLNEPEVSFDRLLVLLAATLDERRLWIRGYPGNFNDRLLLVQGIMMLLPPSVRPQVTFATHTLTVPSDSLWIVFCETEQESERLQYDWNAVAEHFPAEELLNHPYVAWLKSLWTGELSNFIDTLREMDLIASSLMIQETLNENLTLLAQRHALDSAVAHGEATDWEAMKSTMTGSAPPVGPLRQQYVVALLQHALHERDIEAGTIVAQQMDGDAALEAALDTIFHDALENQPDAVYVFMRNRLSESIDEKWLPRLKQAATESLEVAINDGDPETIISWLRLISREPANYDLRSVLHEGIQAAQPRAHEDGTLGQELLLLALKRDPELLETLLDDEALTALLPDELKRALRDNDVERITEIAENLEEIPQGRDIFLVSLARAVRAGNIINTICVDTLWDIYVEGAGNNLPPRYQPQTIVGDITTTYLSRLPQDALEMLLTRMVATGNDDDLFLQTTARLTDHEALFPMLATVLEQSERDVDDVIDLTSRLASAETITGQQLINIYIAVLTELDWQEGTHPLVEQLARNLQKDPELTTTPRVLWKILETASTHRMEPAARLAVRRILARFESGGEETDPVQVVDSLEQIHLLIQWSPVVRRALIDAVRHFARTLQLGMLQKIDRALDGNKTLENTRSIFQTMIALRKMIGQRDLVEVAERISTAYSILEALSTAFDPATKQSPEFDTLTIREEMDQHSHELTPDERHVFSKNLKELAQLIAVMAEHRSKPSLMRSDESLERQLMTGDHRPQSAIDMMKWLSGYMEGTQGEETS